MKFKLDQFLQLDDAYYIVKGLSEMGRPNKLLRANKYGESLSKTCLSNNSPEGWDVNWVEATPLDPKHAKYEKVIAKINHLNNKFKHRELNKKDLTASNLADILTRLAATNYDF